MAVYSRKGEVYGVSCHIKQEPVERFKAGKWKDGSKWGYRAYHDIDYECRYATQISHLQELGRKSANAITKLSITNPRERLEALGDLVQMIPYTYGHYQDPGATIVLYDSAGDCSSKSGLMSAILRNEPWNTMPTFIDCEIGGIGHWTVGLDVDDLGESFNSEHAFTVAPSEEQLSAGYPDTEYAFFDMTYDSTIGHRTDGVQGVDGGPIIIYDEGNFSHRGGLMADEPPDY